MANIYRDVTELIGRTPLLRAERLEEKYGVKAKLLLKLEYLNPAGSVKDRTALQMIQDAEESGLLTPGAVIIEPTSGNTGIGLAVVAAVRGYRVILTMPETMSVERRNILKAYGAEIILTDGSEGMKGAIERAEALQRETPGSILAGQFVNPSNPKVHRRTTGPEIWEDTDGCVDMLVAGVGTGGTITGTGEYLKEKKTQIKVIAVEPSDSPVLSGGAVGAHPLQGIGAGFVPEILNTEICDEVMTITGEEAYEAARELARTEGILCGISSGAALAAAVKQAGKAEMAEKNIVVILPDSGDRYYSTPIFQR